MPLGLSRQDTAYVPGLWINVNRQLLADQLTDAIEGRHLKKRVNVGYVDGHVERKAAADLLVEKRGDIYQNLGLWQADRHSLAHKL